MTRSDFEVLELLDEIAAQVGLQRPVIQHCATPEGREFYGIRSPGEYSLRQDLWDLLCDKYPETGFWPYLSHDGPVGWEWDREYAAMRAALTNSGNLDGSMESRAIDILDSLDLSKEDRSMAVENLAQKVRSATATEIPYARGELMAQVFQHAPDWVCLVRTLRPFELPVVLHNPSTPNWLGNSVLPSLGYSEHAEVLKSWHTRYGAVLFYLGASAMVLQVDRPPTRLAEIAQVALEQVAYCPDLDQIVGGPAELAARQVASRHWFFWWD